MEDSEESGDDWWSVIGEAPKGRPMGMPAPNTDGTLAAGVKTGGATPEAEASAAGAGVVAEATVPPASSFGCSLAGTGIVTGGGGACDAEAPVDDSSPAMAQRWSPVAGATAPTAAIKAAIWLATSASCASTAANRSCAGGEEAEATGGTCAGCGVAEATVGTDAGCKVAEATGGAGAGGWGSEGPVCSD
ncbi:MAG: hypothetical protein GY772_23050 [bacterium]|nr:hypothetical protein [bacterium]